MPDLHNSNFLLLDTETTGISPIEDNIVEVGWMVIDGLGNIIKPCTSSLCASVKPIPPEASAVHHIVDSMLIGAPSPTEILNIIEEDCIKLSVKAIVCHNLGFDGPMLLKEITNQSNFKNLDGICSLRLARRLFPDATSHSLQVLRYALGINNSAFKDLIPHRAKADVIILHEFFKLCIEKYEELTNKHTYKEFLKFADEQFTIKNMPFGKYKGELVDTLPLSYKEWLLKLPELDNDLRYTVEKSLGLVD